MKNFEYYAPTKVIFGGDTENETGRLLKEFNCRKVLVHFGGASCVKSGLLQKIYRSIEKYGIPYVSLGGVVPNPRLSKVNEGIALCKSENVDFVLAVGGGSVIDSAKAICYGAAEGGDVWELYEGKREAKACLPLGCVLTIAAAGSEMSDSSVITKDGANKKRGYSSDLCRPRFAIMNPYLTFSVPAYQTSCGAADILMHTMERYFSLEPDTDFTRTIAETLMRNVVKNAVTLLTEPRNYIARAEIMWAGALSHNGLTGCGTKGDWACHQLQHELSGAYDIAHGAGLAALWGSWARYVMHHEISVFARFAREVFSIKINDDQTAAIKGIEAAERFFAEIGLPVSISGLNINLTEDDAKTLALKCSNNKSRRIGNFMVLEFDDMFNIYMMAR